MKLFFSCCLFSCYQAAIETPCGPVVIPELSDLRLGVKSKAFRKEPTTIGAGKCISDDEETENRNLSDMDWDSETERSVVFDRQFDRQPLTLRRRDAHNCKLASFRANVS